VAGRDFLPRLGRGDLQWRLGGQKEAWGLAGDVDLGDADFGETWGPDAEAHALPRRPSGFTGWPATAFTVPAPGAAGSPE
jgi:hypothetical protein